MLTSNLKPGRRGLIVLGAMLGLFGGFNGLYFAALPFFLLPMAKDLGWGRAEVSLAPVLAMLGVSVAAPFVGRLFDRYGSERVIASSVAAFAVALLAMTQLPPSVPLLGALSFVIGVAGSATTMAGYLSVLPRWFDRRLGLALGCAGIGLGAGVALNGAISTKLIAALGWREAFAVLALMAAVLGALALLLMRAPWQGQGALVKATKTEAAEGLSLREALQGWRFWLLALTTLLVPIAILGSAVHGPALYADRGMTPTQAALGAGLAGIGAMLGRVVTGALLDRFFAPLIAAVILVLGGLGLFINSSAASLPALVTGSLLAGMAFGAEGDLLPYLVRRYFGMRAFGAVFGSVFAVYALGGVLGPLIYGLAFDRWASYTEVMRVAALLSAASGLALLSLGSYRYRPAAPVSSPTAPSSEAVIA